MQSIIATAAFLSVLFFSWVASVATGLGQMEILMAAGLVAYIGKN